MCEVERHQFFPFYHSIFRLILLDLIPAGFLTTIQSMMLVAKHNENHVKIYLNSELLVSQNVLQSFRGFLPAKEFQPTVYDCSSN